MGQAPSHACHCDSRRDGTISETMVLMKPQPLFEEELVHRRTILDSEASDASHSGLKDEDADENMATAKLPQEESVEDNVSDRCPHSSTLKLSTDGDEAPLSPQPNLRKTLTDWYDDVDDIASNREVSPSKETSNIAEVYDISGKLAL